jgi:hypothetical protein
MTTHPLITNDVEMLSYLANLDAPIDAELLTTSMARVSRNSGPQLVSSLFGLGCLMDADVLAAGVEAAWTGAEFPMSFLDAEEWTTLFETTGYLVGSKRRPDLLPTKPIRLYRGASVAGAFGWSWTHSIDTARWFANRPAQRGVGRVWTAEVSPHRIFAHFPDSRGEGEYVVDATAMSIEVSS